MNTIIIRGSMGKKGNSKSVSEACDKGVPIAYVKRKSNGFTKVQIDTDSCFTTIYRYKDKGLIKIKDGCGHQLFIEKLLYEVGQTNMFSYALRCLFEENGIVVQQHKVNGNKNTPNIHGETMCIQFIVKSDQAFKAIEIFDYLWYHVFGEGVKDAQKFYGEVATAALYSSRRKGGLI